MKKATRLCTKAPFGVWLWSLLFCVACSIGVGEKHMQLAEEFFRQGQYMRAVEEYTRVVNFGPKSPLAIKALTQIAVIYEQYRKDYTRAIRAYRDVYRRSSDKHVQMDARFAVAKIYMDRLENPSAAAEEYEALYNEFGKGKKEGSEILFLWGKSLMDSGRFSDAAEKFLALRRDYPGHPDLPRSLIEEGQSYLADRRPELARDRFKELIERHGTLLNSSASSLVAEAYYGLGNALEMLDQLDPALAAYKQSLAMYPNPAVIELKIKHVEARKNVRQLQ